MIEISLILPTRKRVPQLHRALASIVATARRPEVIEVVLYVDDDDADSLAFEFSALQLVKLLAGRARWGRSRARVTLHARADTSCWPTTTSYSARPAGTRKCWRHSAVFPTTLRWSGAIDLCSGVPAHPFLSRAACELLDGVCPAGLLPRVYRHARTRRVSAARAAWIRAGVYLPDVLIEHLHFITGKAAADEGYANRRRQRDELIYIERRDTRPSSGLAGQPY